MSITVEWPSANDAAVAAGRFLHRPIVFLEPDRVVSPPSWLEHTPFAFWMVEALRPAMLVELGCHSGNSYASFVQAVQTLGLTTACYAVDTWRGDPHAGFFDESVFEEWSAYHARYSAFSRLIRATFDDAVDHFADRTIDLLHLDGYHTLEAVAHDFDTWRPKLSDRSVVLCHDINVREPDFGAWRLWQRLRDEFPSFEFLHGHGLGVLGTGRGLPEPVEWLMSLGARDAASVALVRSFFARLGRAVLVRHIAAEQQEKAASGQADLQERLATAHTAIADRDARLVVLESELSTRTTHIAALETELASRAETLDRTTIEISRLNDEVAGAHVQIAESLAKADRLSETIRAAEDARTSRDANSLRVQKQLDESIKAKAETDADLARLRVRLEERADQIASLKTAVSSRDTLVQQLQQDLSERAAWAFRQLERLASLRPAPDPPQPTLSASAPSAAAEPAGSAPRKEEKPRYPYAAYQQLIDRIRATVREVLPVHATAIVISRGDDNLLQLDGRPAWHFPQTERGVYAGHYPADSSAAIAHLEALRARGGHFLVFPSTAFWWLDHYREFRAHLDTTYALVRHDGDCIIYKLAEPAAPVDAITPAPVRSIESLARTRLRAFLAAPADIAFPAVETPTVTIVVPTFNQAHYTFLLLDSLRADLDVPFELIVVDNASTDDTASLLQQVKNIRVHNNERNLGFGAASNLGAEMARGSYLCFLNSDIVVTPGWLRALVETIERQPECGAVAARLVHPDGRLQEAGSIIWVDGSTAGYGRGDDPFAPEYSYARKVDYGSAACLLIRRQLFRSLGGFDERYAPAYYEDADLCMRVRQAGYSIWYQPRSSVLHLEFGSSDAEQAVALQQRHRGVFVERFRDDLGEQGTQSIVLRARDRRLGRRVLVVDDRLPLSILGSGFPRTRLLLDALVNLGHVVTYLPRTDPTPHEPATTELQQLGIEVLHSVGNIRSALARRPNLYDLAIVSRPHNARIVEAIREFNPTAAIVYDAEAVSVLRELRQAEAEGRYVPATEIDARIRAELGHVAAADLVIAVSAAERRLFQRYHPATPVTVWGYPAKIQPPSADCAERRDLLFVGNLATSPNADAVQRLITEIFPRIRKELDCRLLVVGANPSADAFGAFLRHGEGVVLTGFVNDLASVYARCRVFVAPHRFAAGIPIKVLEAMSYGIPCVVSRLLAEQLELTDGAEALVADDVREFAEKTTRLYTDHGLWSAVQQRARRLLEERYDPMTLQAQLHTLIEEAIAAKRAASAGLSGGR